jgi:hypothetical protein
MLSQIEFKLICGVAFGRELRDRFLKYRPAEIKNGAQMISVKWRP